MPFLLYYYLKFLATSAAPQQESLPSSVAAENGCQVDVMLASVKSVDIDEERG